MKSRFNFMKTFDYCLKKYVNIPIDKFEKFEMGRLSEKKYFLPMVKDFNEENCKWLTIGIGGDTKVEAQFHEKYPKCKIFGVEPGDKTQIADFEKYGTPLNVGVGVEESSIPLIVREPKRYVEKNISVVPMDKLLEKNLKTKTVHYMTIDIEGYEYDLLKELLPGKVFYEKNVTFCQFDAELHEKFKDDKIMDVQSFLMDFIANDSPYFPAIRTPFYQHEKVTFINIESKECEETFNFRKYLF